LQPLERLSGSGFQSGEFLVDGMPDDVQIEPIISVPQSIAHAADIAPRLVRHQCCRAIAEAVGGLAYALQTTFDGVACLSVGGKCRTARAGNVIRDPFSVVDDVRQRLGRIMFRRQVGGPG
jgi:hypothetical protein